MPELLFELGCEEIPADDLFVLSGELVRIASAAFEQNRLVHSNLETQSTPRRLVLKADIEARQKDRREQKLGPPRKVALDASGNATPAGAGFAKNAGIPFQKLKFVTTPKGEYLCAEILQKGKPATSVLKQIIPEIVAKLPFHKFMRWDNSNFVFGRPVRKLLLLFGGKVISLRIAGVSAGKNTFGHRFLGENKIPVTSYTDYCELLAANGVLLQFDERVQKIRSGLEQHASASGGTLRSDDELLRVMANEVEFPEVLTGQFPSGFLALPQEILINAMRKHQKYFCSVDKDGNLLPVFHTILNTRAQKPDLIRQGHERVLLARLRDAEFFWQEDLKTSLSDRIPQLERLTYHEKLGSYSIKLHRMQEIGRILVHQTGNAGLEGQLSRLIDHCKADLVTHMVGEFPELQGKMGGLYARAGGYPEEEWRALYDQYRPVSADDSSPGTLTGALLSLTDRIEILASGYVLNMAPTGSKDPYALRRVSTGAMKIILDYKLKLDLRAIFEQALNLYTVKTKLTPGEMLRGLLDLMESRFRYLMEQQGVAHDYLNAILNVEKDYVTALAKAGALRALQNSGEMKVLARGFKRINNIIYDQPSLTFDSARLQDDGEIRLHRAFTDLRFRVQQNIDESLYSDALEIMVTLGPEIDNFFDEVMVMVEQTELRTNRIALLQQISELYRRIADFSALQIEL